MWLMLPKPPPQEPAPAPLPPLPGPTAPPTPSDPPPPKPGEPVPRDRHGDCELPSPSPQGVAFSRGESSDCFHHVYRSSVMMKRLVQLASVVAVVLGVTAFIQADETKGTIKSVDANRREISVKGTIETTTYDLSKDATVWLDGVRCKLTDLKPDDRAVIDYEKKGNQMIATMVRGLRKCQETTGTVADVFGDKREVTLKGTIKNTTYELAKGGTVFADGKMANLSDIHKGDTVLITYEQRGDRYVANDMTVLKRAK